jgi:hypothetical protein
MNAGALVAGTALFTSGAATAVRAAFSGAMSVVGDDIANIPRGMRAVTPQRGVPTNEWVKQLDFVETSSYSENHHQI